MRAGAGRTKDRKALRLCASMSAEQHAGEAKGAGGALTRLKGKRKKVAEARSDEGTSSVAPLQKRQKTSLNINCATEPSRNCVFVKAFDAPDEPIEVNVEVLKDYQCRMAKVIEHDCPQQLADGRDTPDVEAVELAREQPTSRCGATADGQAAATGTA